ncbi:MAG TPA: hypothetical protein VE029_05980, partial [Rhizobacter sp.]|nr:hypothetical protein [Rhizobacter sp.]
LKLLALAPDNPASRRALQIYLPATARGLGGKNVPALASLNYLVATGPRDPGSLAQVAQALCKHLDTLQSQGDPKWRELRPGLHLPVWSQDAPMSAAEAAWSLCG